MSIQKKAVIALALKEILCTIPLAKIASLFEFLLFELHYLSRINRYKLKPFSYMRTLYHHVQWYRVTINDLNENEPQTRPRNCQSRERRTGTPGVIEHEDYNGRQFYCSRT